MTIAVVSEVSSKSKNAAVINALKKFDFEILNLGMKDIEGESELTYIHTGLISAVLLNAGCVDLVVGGCGTGQGYLNAITQYPGAFCGLVESPLDAWLFQQINGGNAISLALNKGFGWAGDINLEFVFERLFSVESGSGYPPHRAESQAQSRAMLQSISALTHRSMAEIISLLPDAMVNAAIGFPGIMETLRAKVPSHEITAACEMRLTNG